MKFKEMISNSIEKDALVLSGENQLKKFGTFLEKHQIQLKNLISHDEKQKYFCYDINYISLEQYAPISIDYNSKRENLTNFQLIESDNKILNKILVVFAELCDQIKVLCEKSEILQKKFLFYDEDLLDEEQQCDNNEKLNYKNLIKISEILPYLFQLKYLLQRCLIISHNLIRQLGALFEQEKYYINIQTSIHFQSVFNQLGELMLTFVIFDEILPTSNIAKYWPVYKKSVKTYEQNSEKFTQKYDTTVLNGLEVVLNELEEVFSGNLFQNCIDLYCGIKTDISARAFATYTGHFQSYLRSSLNEILKYSTDLTEFLETSMIIKINAMCIIYHNIFGNLDQKIFKNLIDANTRNCCITLIGNIIWLPIPFIKKHSETLLKGYEKYLLEYPKIQKIYLTSKIQNLIKETQNYCIQIAAWILRFKEMIKQGNNEMKMEQLRTRCSLIIQGVQFAGQTSNIIKSLTNLHILLKVPMQKSCLQSICKLIEFLKLITIVFQHNIGLIIELVQCIVQYLQYQILFIVASTKKKIPHDTSYSERHLDILSAFQIVEKCLYGPATLKRLIVTRLALSAADPLNTFSPDYLQKIEKNLIRLEMIVELQDNINKISEPSFLYWHQYMLPIYLKQVMDNDMDLLKIIYLLHSSEDCGNLYKTIESENFQCIENYNENVKIEFKNEIIQRICTHIETSLRLDFHSNLPMNTVDPFVNKTSNDYRSLIRLKPIQLSDCHVIIKDHIEHYLSNMFYNLTTISLHDWRAYGEMRRLALQKFDLKTVEDHLPTQTHEQGLDVLEIMRNIHVFVSKYLYNLNNQIFIEESSNNRYLNTINIRHIANSLRTHGTGIINTTVNFTYQFLRKKFFIFSQFMYDEHIKSRLIKDLKYFRENTEKNLKQGYSFERADAFNKGIRKLGLSPTGQSYLDLFRLLISHIGNAMGYVRMIRSGGLHSCSMASVFLPVLNDDLTFEDVCVENKLSEITCKAAENLEFDIKNLVKSYTEGTDYLQLLVEAFAPFFRNPKNTHLKNFYLIVPPLTINFIDHILTSKDKMTKKNKDGALFTDDGFAMGLAYILKLLDQMTDFNSLYWFKSIRLKYNREREIVMKQREAISSNDDDKLLQTLLLTEKRITKVQQEYDLLYYNLSSAKIFFK